jgi:hypothetical protein
MTELPPSTVSTLEDERAGKLRYWIDLKPTTC